jgi:hypothetical protein
VSDMASRIAARFRRKLADQPPGRRKHVHDLVRPINKPKGIDQGIVQDEAESKEPDKETDIIKPHHRDIQPKDVFSPPLPKNVAVRDFVETGKDLGHALDKQVPKDKGYETVNNLSQYLIRTEGGGEGGPEGKQK